MSVNVGNAFMTIVPKLGSTSTIESGLTKSSKTLGNKFNGAFKKAAVGAAALTAAAGIATKAVKSAMDSVASYGDNVDKASQKMGISAQGYQQWSYVLERNGSSINSLQVGMKTLTSKIESGSDAFNALGVATKNADGSFKDTEQVMNDSISALAGVEDQTQRTALANELFGKRTAQELAPMLNSGSASIEELKTRAEELGMVMSDKAVKASADYTDAMTDLSGSVTGLKNNMVGGLLPIATEVASGMSESIGQMSKAIYDADGDIGKIGEAIGNGLSDIVNQITAKLPEFVSMAGTIITSLATGIANSLPTVIPTLVTTLVNLLPTLISTISTIITSLAQAIPQCIPPIIQAIPTIVLSIVDALCECVPALIDGAIEMVMAIVDNLPTIINALIAKMPYIITRLVQALTKCIPKLIQCGINLFVSLVKNMPAIIAGIIKAIPKIINALKTGFGSFFSAMGDVGINLIKGLWEGIKGTADWLWNKIKGWFGDQLNKIKEFLGIHSPSTVFAEIGKYSAQGFGVGFENEFGGVSSRINGLMDFSANAGSARSVGGGVVVNLNYDAGADANQMVLDIARGLKQYRMMGA